jgi:hypothetical protein
MNKKIKLVGVWSDNFKNIYDIYNKSIEKYLDYFEVCLCKIDLKEFNVFGFGTPSWYEAAVQKLDFIIKNLNELREGELLVFNDLDIQYLNPMNTFRVLDFMECKKLDFCGTKEFDSDKYNGGYYILRNTKNIIKLICSIKEELKLKKPKYADQDILNEIIHDANINHALMPREFFINGPHGGITQEAIMHHTTYADTVHDKIVQMKMIYSNYFKTKYAESDDFPFGDSFGELNRTNGIKLTDDIYINDPFVLLKNKLL